MDIQKMLQDHYNKLHDLKSTLKNIKDTCKDGVADNLQVRTRDGQLRMNPDIDDITNTINAIENMQKDVEKKLIILKKERQHSKQINRSSKILSK